MGAIHSILNDQDRAKEELKDAAAQLDALSELAQTKADLFAEKIGTRVVNAGQGTDKTVPITQVIAFKSETHAYVSKNSTEIVGNVGKAIEGFIEGGSQNILSGVTTLLSTAVEALFGSSSGGEGLRDEYYIVNEGIALVRLDFMGWKRKVTGKSLTTKVEQVSAFTICKSVVDMDKLDFGTFMTKYQTILKAENPKLTSQELLEACKKAYEAFKSTYDQALQAYQGREVAYY